MPSIYCEVGGLCTLEKTKDWDCELNPLLTMPKILAYSGLEQHYKYDVTVGQIYELMRDGFTVIILH